MKSTGITRKIDDLGRIVIPKELRRTFDIAEGDPLEIFVDGENIILRKYHASESCVLCGVAGDKHFEKHNMRHGRSGKRICDQCYGEILVV